MGRGHHDYEAVCSPLWITSSPLFPQMFFFGNLVCDFAILPLQHGRFSEKAKMNAALLRCDLTELAGLPVLTPQVQALSHFFLGRGSIVQKCVGLENVVVERVRYPPRISAQERKQFSRGAHSYILATHRSCFDRYSRQYEGEETALRNKSKRVREWEAITETAVQRAGERDCFVVGNLGRPSYGGFHGSRVDKMC